jgi:hypothetical protein
MEQITTHTSVLNLCLSYDPGLQESVELVEGAGDRNGGICFLSPKSATDIRELPRILIRGIRANLWIVCFKKFDPAYAGPADHISTL